MTRARLLRPLVLTGGPAVGKSTCARALAQQRPRAAFVDADDVRQLVVAGAVTLWGGPGGPEQHALAARNVAALARNLLTDGFEVTVADVVTADTLAVYRAELPDCLVVALTIGLDEARRRAATRPVHLTDAEFDWLHALTARPLEADVSLAVDGLNVDEQVAQIRAHWTTAP